MHQQLPQRNIIFNEQRRILLDLLRQLPTQIQEELSRQLFNNLQRIERSINSLTTEQVMREMQLLEEPIRRRLQEPAPPQVANRVQIHYGFKILNKSERFKEMIKLDENPQYSVVDFNQIKQQFYIYLYVFC